MITILFLTANKYKDKVVEFLLNIEEEKIKKIGKFTIFSLTLFLDLVILIKLYNYLK